MKFNFREAQQKTFNDTIQGACEIAIIRANHPEIKELEKEMRDNKRKFQMLAQMSVPEGHEKANSLALAHLENEITSTKKSLRGGVTQLLQDKEYLEEIREDIKEHSDLANEILSSLNQDL